MKTLQHRCLVPAAIGLFLCAFASIPALAADPAVATETSATGGATNAADALLAKATKILTYGDRYPGPRPTKSDAVIALGVLGDERAVPILVDHLANSPDQNLRLQIARALEWIASPKAVSGLEAALRDPYPYTRQEAARALKTITGKDYEFDRTGLPDPAKLREALRLPSQATR